MLAASVDAEPPATAANDNGRAIAALATLASRTRSCITPRSRPDQSHSTRPETSWSPLDLYRRTHRTVRTATRALTGLTHREALRDRALAGDVGAKHGQNSRWHGPS